MSFSPLLSLLVITKSLKDQPLKNYIYIPWALLAADCTGYLLHRFVDESKITGSGSFIDTVRIEFQHHHEVPKDLIDIPFYQQASAMLPITLGVGALSLLFPKSSPPRGILGVIAATAPFQNLIHQYAHKRTHNVPIPSWIKRLQDSNIIISGQEHRKHHIHPQHQGHWSSFTPLSNRILDPIFVKSYTN